LPELRINIRACLICLFLPLVLSCAPKTPNPEFALGTVCGINLYEGGSAALYARIFARIREIDRTMSAGTRPAVSTVALINRNAGIAPVSAGPDLIAVLETAVYYAALSGGAFDPTVGPLVRLWGIGTDAERVPDAAEIAEALALVDWRNIVIDRAAGTVFLRRRGMALDLGAIAKGYAADEAARIARKGGARRGIFDFGGNIVALGSRDRGGRGAAGGGWRIGVQDPLRERGAYIGVLPVIDKSIVTSGVYERYFEFNGRRYHHILSTADGRPVDNGLLSVTIVAERSIDADALSTAAFALGYERGRALVESAAGAEAVFVFDDCSVRTTGALRGVFRLTSEAYTLIEE
jgi:thiamine biosynthesis lipoprotein